MYSVSADIVGQCMALIAESIAVVQDSLHFFLSSVSTYMIGADIIQSNNSPPTRSDLTAVASNRITSSVTHYTVDFTNRGTLVLDCIR